MSRFVRKVRRFFRRVEEFESSIYRRIGNIRLETLRILLRSEGLVEIPYGQGSRWVAQESVPGRTSILSTWPRRPPDTPESLKERFAPFHDMFEAGAERRAAEAARTAAKQLETAQVVKPAVASSPCPFRRRAMPRRIRPIVRPVLQEA